MFKSAATFTAILLAAGCTISGEDDSDSPYESATITLSSATGLADNLSEIVVTVEGLPDSELVIEVEGAGATFILSDQVNSQQKTVYLTDVDGVGTATASIVANETGTAEVRLEGDPVRTARTVTFEPVRIAAGELTPVRYDKGRVVHDLCVAVNSPDGLLFANTITVSSLFAPAQTDVNDVAPSGLDCPTVALDEFGWRGFAPFSWTTSNPNAEVTIEYASNDGVAIESTRIPLEGLAFPGYEVSSDAPVLNGTLASVTVTFSYPASGPLASAPAAGVSLTIPSFLPATNSPLFIGSTSGGELDMPVTDESGEVTLFFNTELISGTFAMFATPENGSAVYVTDLVLP